VDEGEMRTLLHAHAGVSHNPSSNLKLASGVAPVKRMLELGLNVGIGTDGPASNNDLDMFEEVRLAAFLAKGASGDPTALPAQVALQMATRLGARALHMGDITGSLEPGKRADLILVDLSTVHNSPRFQHDPNSRYAQIVYAAKSTDVSDVMINGQWVMRDHQLLTLNEAELISAAQAYAQQIDTFLIQREQSVLSKLIAVGGAMEQESFEIQAKVPIADSQAIIASLSQPGIEIVRQRHYREYDTYFTFEDAKQGYLRYREDHFIDDNGKIYNVRSRLTLLGTREFKYQQAVLLSRSRYYAPAVNSLRFYREYFRPVEEKEVEKDRMRFLIRFKDTEFFINIDEIHKPPLGKFMEVKSRTWSRQDANHKATLATELMEFLGALPAETTSTDYIEMVKSI
jgi:5-methylthioadenosine/S-adenosylhomocysteine deaminase